MKRAAIAVSSLLVASLGLAGEQPTTPKEPAQPAKPAVAAAPTPAASDSPLVKAAKTTNRAKKRIVITNESLKSSTGHVTTTKSQPPVYEPKLTERDYQARRSESARSAPATTTEAKKADETGSAKLPRLAAETDDPYSEMDPAMLEHQLEKNAQQAPKEEKKKP